MPFTNISRKITSKNVVVMTMIHKSEETLGSCFREQSIQGQLSHLLLTLPQSSLKPEILGEG